MADAKDAVDQVFKFWQQGQDAFFNAQQDLADGFAKSMAKTLSPKPKDKISEGFDAWQDFVKAWAPGWDPAAAMTAGAGDMFSAGKDAMFNLFDPATWMSQSPDQLKTILQNIANAPQFADLVMPQTDMASAWQESVEFQEATADFAKVMHEAWLRSYTEYSKAFDIEELKSGKATDALNAWLKIANKELLDVQSSKEFMNAQKHLMSAATSLKKRQAEAAEKWAESFQMPTRSEIDDLTKTVTELRRELREIKRKL